MNKNNFNKEVKKEGWNKMKIILDKEMPVKKRRFLPFLLLLLIPAALGIIFIYSKTTKKQQNQIFIKQQKNRFSSVKNIKQSLNINTTSNNFKNLLNNKKNNEIKRKTNKNDKTNPHKIKKLHKKEYKLIADAEKKNNIKNLVYHKMTYVENNIALLNKLTFLNIKTLITQQRKYRPQFDFHDLNLTGKKDIGLFTPVMSIKLHAYNYKKFSPKLEFDFGNYFNISDRFSFGIVMALTQRNLVYQAIQKERYILNDSYYTEVLNFKNEYEIEQKDYSKWIFELMIKEKYNINKRIFIDFGGGIVLGGMKRIKINYDYTSKNDLKTEYNPGDFKPILFIDMGLYYFLTKKINAGFGYKYYYSGTYNYNNMRNNEVHSQKLVNKKYSSRLFLGINYCF